MSKKSYNLQIKYLKKNRETLSRKEVKVFFSYLVVVNIIDWPHFCFINIFVDLIIGLVICKAMLMKKKLLIIFLNGFFSRQ